MVRDTWGDFAGFEWWEVRGTRGDRSRDSGDETKSDAIWISAGEPMNAFSSSLMPGCALARVDGQHGD